MCCLEIGFFDMFSVFVLSCGVRKMRFVASKKNDDIGALLCVYMGLVKRTVIVPTSNKSNTPDSST